MEVKCSGCGKELDEKNLDVNWKYCTFCKSPICSDCTHFMAVKRKGLYKEYIETIPVCENCTPKKRMDRKLAEILDEVLGRTKLK